MTSKEVLNYLYQTFGHDAAYVCSLGRTAEEAFRISPSSTLFLDSMGDVCRVATGVAMSLGPSIPVVAIDTEGSHLMALSFLPCLGSLISDLSNLSIVVLNNGIYESAGGLPSSRVEIDWTLLGKAFQIDVAQAHTMAELEQSIRSPQSEFSYTVAFVQNEEDSEVTKNIDGLEAKYRFIRHLEALSKRLIISPPIKN